MAVEDVGCVFLILLLKYGRESKRKLLLRITIRDRNVIRRAVL